MSRFKAWLKKTPLYTPLRAVWNAIRTRTRVERIERRDSRQMAAILRRVLQSGGNGIDVGAHRGDVLAEFIRHSPLGRHIAIEPIPELADFLKSAYPGVAIHPAAAGETSGSAEFQWVTSNPAFSGLKRRPDLRPEEVVCTVAVPIVRLDDLVPAGLTIAVLKIDVEGAELGVLRGAARILAESRPWVLLEHGSAALAYDTTTTKIVSEFDRHRMALWLMADRPPLTADAFAAAVDSGDYWNFLAGPAPELRGS